MPARRPLAAVVLAGGASRRMGRDKATMAHPAADPGQAGSTMVERTVGVLAARCSPVFVVAAPRQRLPRLDAVILRDEVCGAGPLPAAGRGLRAAAAAGRDRAFVCAVDMPGLRADLVDQLAAHPGADIVLAWDGRDHYLAAVYRTGLADRIEAMVAAGERRMGALADALGAVRVAVPATAVANLNKPSDLP